MFGSHDCKRRTVFLTSVTLICRKFAHFLEFSDLRLTHGRCPTSLAARPVSDYLLIDRHMLISMRKMTMTELLRIPNLLSLARIALIAPLAYFLSQSNEFSTVASVTLMAFAGITDGLDGYLARRMGLVSRLGIALDPIADKLFAAALVVLLILFRGLPVWLGIVIVGRDLIILVAGSILLKGRKITLPSNLTGKYAFFAIIMLLLSYTTYFHFGVVFLTWITLILILASLINYGRLFVRIRAGEPPPVFNDTPLLRTLRVIATTALSALWLITWFIDVVMK